MACGASVFKLECWGAVKYARGWVDSLKGEPSDSLKCVYCILWYSIAFSIFIANLGSTIDPVDVNPLLDLERPLFFSLCLVQEAIWTWQPGSWLITHHLTLSAEPAAVPLYLKLVSQPGRKILTPCGEGREWPKWDGGFESDRYRIYSQHSTAWSTSKTQQGSKTLSFCFVAQVVSWNALEALWGQPSTGFKNIRKKHRPKRCERMNQKWRDMDQDYDYDDYKLWRFLIIIDINGRIIEPRSFALHWLGLPNQAQTLLGVSEALQV